ncbi:MAG: glycosyltransferase [Flavobacteriales bacterium]
MAPRRVLHIVNWYPNQVNKNAAVWIREQIRALDRYSPSDVVHIEVKPGKKWRKLRPLEDDVLSYAYEVPFRQWFLIELMTAFLLFYVLFIKKRSSNYSIIDLHIAYPLCTYLHLFRRAIKVPLVISEHWSAYHFNFYVADTEKLYRIKRIFRKNKIPVITVSRSLKNDIERFSGVELRGYVLPNVVSMDGALPEGHLSPPYRFMMLGAWKAPKKPLLAIRAFLEAFKGRSDVEMCIGGHDRLAERIKQEVEEHEGDPPLFFLGKLDKQEVEAEMKKTHAFVHCSEHETFSVVCAEALSNGVPVLASDKGGIGEFVTPEVGILVPRNEEGTWCNAFMDFEARFLRGEGIDRKKIAKAYRDRFGPQRVGREYAELLEKEVERQAGH